MQIENSAKAKIKENIIYYALIFLAVIATPILSAQTAKLFDWAVLSWSQQGELRPFFTELFTAIFWLIEWIVFLYARDRFIQKQQTSAVENIVKNKEESLAQEAAISDDRKGKRAKKSRYKQSPLLPRKNMAILFLITVVCIVVVTLQIGLKVKPFYELGDKTTYTKMLIKGGEVLRDLTKGIWIVSILKTALLIVEELPFFDKVSKKYATLLKWLGICLLAIIFGVFELLIFDNPFFWTYILFYVAFTAIYFFTARAPIKSYLLICFIYIF